ncbi:hypothetical protein [Streptacidiphilus melanogenes]|uniref:hypothetical protein n=1 Tax=Streptacidiphilus melanogenes TaxID=411235 RepID=UPI0005A7DA8A|nr:hypothetical protein [Streptacidiphilus melanogenes]
MLLPRLTGHIALLAATLALAAVPLALPATARAAEDTLSLSVGPVPVPNVPVSVCLDSSCVATPPLTSVSLTVAAGVRHGPLPVVVLTAAACPAGGKGVAISVTSLAPVTVTVSASVSGITTAGGPLRVPLGPVTQQLTPGSPGLLVSACTD